MAEEEEKICEGDGENCVGGGGDDDSEHCFVLILPFYCTIQKTVTTQNFSLSLLLQSKRDL